MSATELAFFRALQDLGYIEGQTIQIEYRWAEGHEERLPALAADLVALNVDAIFAWNLLPGLAAKHATESIPVILGAGNDPVGTGLVASLAHPGGNVTGLSSFSPNLTTKRLEFLTKAFPRISRLAVLAYKAGATTEQDWREAQAAGQALGLGLWRYDVAAPEDLDGAFDALVVNGADAVINLSEQFFTRHRQRLVDLVGRQRLPAIYEQRLLVDTGGLMSYGANFEDVYRRAAGYVDRILKGAKPADLPIEQPTAFDFVINLKTAQALGLSIPQSILQQATEIIQ